MKHLLWLLLLVGCGSASAPTQDAVRGRWEVQDLQTGECIGSFPTKGLALAWIANWKQDREDFNEDSRANAPASNPSGISAHAYQFDRELRAVRK